MTEYPMDFGTGYKIQTVFANKVPDGAHEDMCIYDSKSEAERAHPGAEIMTGYYVIEEASGLVPDCCNSWNDTISEAIQDYEDHIVPILEREEDIELNSTELDDDGFTIRETLFSVKSGWLQDYLGVDNQAQLEALLTNSEEWDPTEILKDARNEPELSGLSVGEVTEGEVENQKDEKKSDVLELFEKISSLSKHPHYQIAADMAYLQDHIDLDEPLSPDILYTLASRLFEASSSHLNEPLLHEEYLDAIRYLLEFGISENQSPDLPSLGSADTLQLLLTADDLVFASFVETVAINSREFYNTSVLQEDIDVVAPVIEAMRDKKNLSASHIADVQTHSVSSPEPLPKIDLASGLEYLITHGTQGITVFPDSEVNASYYDNAIKYWSNSMGELHHHGTYDISEDDLPLPLKQVYQEFELFERYKSRSYLVETENGYGIALVNEYDECFANDCNLTMDQLFFSAVVDAATIRSYPDFDGTAIFLGKYLGFDSCHELTVVFPADISKESFEKAAKLLDQIAYKAAAELQQADEVLKRGVLTLDVKGTTVNVLKKAGFSTIGDLLSVSPEELIKLYGWGERTLSDINQAVAALAEEHNNANLRLWAQASKAFQKEVKQHKNPSLDAQIQSAATLANESPSNTGRNHRVEDRQL